MGKRIPPLDLMFLLTETPNNPKHVGAVMSFDLPGGRGREMLDRIVATYRAAKPLAPFSYVPQLLGVGMPQWKSASEIDSHYHVQHLALPPGATEADLYKLVEDLHETVLDRNRPLYRIWFIEGLNGGRSFAIYLKIHHAIVDGASAMMRIGGSLSADSKAAVGAPFFALAMPDRKPRPPASLMTQLSAINDTARRQSLALKDLSLEVLRKGLGRLKLAAARGSQPFTAVHTPMNEPVRTARSFASLALPVSEMRAVSKAFDGTINDVAVTIVDAGLHRYLEAIGHPIKRPLVVMCPVSLRDADDKEATTKVSAIFVPLGAPGAAIGDRMVRVMAAIGSAKDDVKAMTKDAAMMYGISAFGLGEAADLTRIGRWTGHAANFVLSNVPGAREPLFLDGARLTGIFPVSAMGAGIGLNVTLASNADVMGFGFIGNGLALPRLNELATFTRVAFDELKLAAGGKGPITEPAGKSAGRRRAAGAKKAAAAKRPRRRSG